MYAQQALSFKHGAVGAGAGRAVGRNVGDDFDDDVRCMCVCCVVDVNYY